MDPLRSSPAVLLHHDGELADVRRLLDELGAHCVERLGAAEEEERTATWDVIVASPRRILHFRPGATGSAATRIAVVDGDSRTLRAHLRRMRIEWIVRRPVHPAALRLLLLHVLYRGPERRRRRRVSVGADVRIRSGLFGHAATLTDFSVRGCRLLSRHPVTRGKRIKVVLPACITGGRTLGVKGTVVRSGPASSRDPGVTVMGVRFDEASEARRRRLEEVLLLHATGPAMLARRPRRPVAQDPPAEAAPAVREAARATGDTGPAAAARAEPVEHAGVGPVAAAAGIADDRRRDPRHAYDRRVVALGDEATRVLLGRDISTGGMRVGAHPGLAVGDRFRLALHAGTRTEPFVVDAVVQRCDGERGLVLRFGELDEDQHAALEGIVADLPVVSGHDATDSECGWIVSEIVDREQVG